MPNIQHAHELKMAVVTTRLKAFDNKISCRTINFFNRVNRAINYINRALTR